MIKKAIIALSVVLLVLTVGVLRSSANQNSINAEEIKQMNAEILRLGKQRDTLKKQINELEDQLGYQKEDTAGSVYLCFTAADDRLVDEIYPFLLENEVPGVIVLRNGYTIGKQSFLNAERVAELEEAGWEFAIGPGSMMEFAGDESDVERFKAYMSEYLATQGRGISAVYFDLGQYQSYLDDAIRELGFTTVFYESDDTSAESDSLKRIPVMGYQNIQMGTATTQQFGGEVGLRVTINWIESTPLSARYEPTVFAEFVKNLVFLRDSGLMDFPVLMNGNESQNSAAQELERLYQELEKVGQELRKVYR